MAKASRKKETEAPKESIVSADELLVQQVQPAVIGPEVIISNNKLADDLSPDIESYNDVDEEKIITSEPEIIKLEKVEVPVIRKVAIKKIDRFTFRLGLERSKEKYRMMPGTGHTWAPAKKGNEFITGLEKYPEKRKELERELRVDLSPTSSYYATLTFRLEDKEHGQIMNFDDRQMGPFYEVVYYAMLADDLIANGLHEVKSGKKPFAEWYIENKEAEAELLQSEMTAEIEATNAFPSLSFTRRHDVAKLLGLPVWGVSEKVASRELWNFIKQNSDNAIAFNKLVDLSPTEIAVRVVVKSAIKVNVLRRDKLNNYTFNGEVLGPTEDHVVAKLVVATNSSLRLAIERQLKAKLT